MIVLVVSPVIGVAYAANTIPVLAARINAQALIINGFLKFYKQGFLGLKEGSNIED